MKKLLNKYICLSLLAACITLAACSNDDEDYSVGPQTASDCPALTFGSNNVVSEELDPTDATTVTITVYRNNGTAEASYPIKVLSNTENVFSVPATISFASGADKATVTVSFDNAEIGKAYTLEIGLEDADVDPYSENTYTSYVYTCTRVKWNTLGTGQYLDGFWYGFCEEVTIQQRDDDPTMYRVNSPYTDELVTSYEGLTATYTEYLIFKLSASGYISWSEGIYMNTLYEAGSPEIIGHYDSTYADYSYAEYDEEGNIRYFVIAPYWYVEGMGGWDPSNGYNCYIAFPGVDLATEWEW